MSLESIYQLELADGSGEKNLLPVAAELQSCPLTATEVLPDMERRKGALRETSEIVNSTKSTVSICQYNVSTVR